MPAGFNCLAPHDRRRLQALKKRGFREGPSAGRNPAPGSLSSYNQPPESAFSKAISEIPMP